MGIRRSSAKWYFCAALAFLAITWSGAAPAQNGGPLPHTSTGYVNPCNLTAVNDDFTACVDTTNQKVTFKRVFYDVKEDLYTTTYSATVDLTAPPDAISAVGSEGAVTFPDLQMEFGFVVSLPQAGQIAVFNLTMAVLSSVNAPAPPVQTLIPVPGLYANSMLKESTGLSQVWISLNNGSIGIYDATTAVYIAPSAHRSLMALPAAIPTPPGAANPPNALNLANGSDGNLYFTETPPTDAMGNPIFTGQENIGRLTPAGVYTQYPVPSLSPGTADYNTKVSETIVAGPDGNIWFLEPTASPHPNIARLAISGATAGTITEFPLPSGASTILGIGTGADGNVWVKDYNGQIHRVTPAGSITSFTIPTMSAGSDVELVPAPDGALWFNEDTQIARITTTGTITEFTLPTPTINGTPIYPFQLKFQAGAIGSFLEYGTENLDLFTLPPSPSTLVASILPSSRSVAVGATATVFATMINAGTSTATGCYPALASSVPVSLSYQTTNPATNALTGTPDTPADITAGGDQTFVLSLTVNGAQPPTDTAIGFSCANADAAAIVSGIDTLLLSGSTSPVPDIVALAATASGNGTVDITGTNGTGAFAVASENVGAVGSITVSAAASETTLPLAVSICQTNPANGQCLAAPASSVTTTIDANATPTFSIFATASGAIDFSPAVNRIAVQFTDATGLVRGSTSVAVQTQ